MSASPSPTAVIEDGDDCVTVRLNRPEVRTAINRETMDALLGIATSCSRSPRLPGPARRSALSSVTKLWWSTTHQRLVDLGCDFACRVGDEVDRWFPLWLESRAETMYASASQIQRNIISERLLGLPR